MSKILTRCIAARLFMGFLAFLVFFSYSRYSSLAASVNSGNSVVGGMLGKPDSIASAFKNEILQAAGPSGLESLSTAINSISQRSQEYGAYIVFINTANVPWMSQFYYVNTSVIDCKDEPKEAIETVAPKDIPVRVRIEHMVMPKSILLIAMDSGNLDENSCHAAGLMKALNYDGDGSLSLISSVIVSPHKKSNSYENQDSKDVKSGLFGFTSLTIPILDKVPARTPDKRSSRVNDKKNDSKPVVTSETPSNSSDGGLRQPPESRGGH